MIYSFNDITINTVNYQLSKDDKSLSIEPQVFNIILYLIENKDRIVSRQELLDTIWKGKIVSDSSISNHIKSARKVIGDDGTKQAVIKTIHGRGYQFIALLKESKTPTSSQNSKNKSLVGIKTMAGIAVVMFVSIVWFYNQAPSPHRDVNKNNFQDKSIAVLAFKDLSPQSDQQYFSDGITEELLNVFTQIPDLRVASRTSSFSFKNKPTTIENIGKELNVAYVIEGSIRKSGEKLRITVQLIRVKDGSHIWSKIYDHEFKDILNVQDKIAIAVSEQLEISLSNGMIKSKIDIVIPEAHSLYLKALYFFRENTDISIQQASETIKESIAKDPNYALAWMLNSRIQYRLAVYSYDNDDSINIMLSKEAINIARNLDNNLSSVNAQMALINLLDYNFESARFNIDIAMNLADQGADAIEMISHYFLLTGQIEKSIQILNQALDLDPVNDVYYLNLSRGHLILNQLNEADKFIRKYGYYHMNSVSQHAVKSYVLLVKGNYQQAQAEVEQEANEFWKLSILEFLNFAQGNRKLADEKLNTLVKDYSYSPAHLATHYAFRKDPDNAFKWLELAYQNNDSELLYIINHHTFRNLWGNPRWDKFIEKMGLPKGHWLRRGDIDKKS